MRPSGRAHDQLRPVSLELDAARHAEGSCLVRFGDTHVLCAATVEERVPPFLRNTRQGLGHRRVRHAAALDQHPHRRARRRAASSPAAPRRSSG